MGVVGVVPCVQNAYYQLESVGEDEGLDREYAWRQDDAVLPLLCVVQMVAYLLPFFGFFGGASTSPLVASALTLVQYTMFIGPLLALSFFKLKSFKPPRNVSQAGFHSLTYFMTLGTTVVDMVQLSSLCLTRASRTPHSVFNLLVLDTGLGNIEMLVFCVSVSIVFLWLIVLNVSAASTKMHGRNKYADLLSSVTALTSLLFITITLSIMRAMRCVQPSLFTGPHGMCWRGTHAVVLFFGFFSLQHLLVASVLFSSVLGMCKSLQPYFLPYFTTFDRTAKFVVCAAVVFSNEGDQSLFVSVLTLACAGLLLLASRRGDTTTSLFTLRGPCSDPSINPYVTLQFCGVVWSVCVSLLLRNEVVSELWALFLVCSGWSLLFAKLLSSVSNVGLGGMIVDPENQLCRSESGAESAKEEEMWHACDDQEAEDEYCEGGYHRVHIGDVYSDRYKVLCKLGWGKFSTVWLVHNLQESTELSALKICKSTPEFGNACLYEVGILKKMSAYADSSSDPNKDYVVRLMDYFEIEGPHGTHVSMVLEPLGPNLLKLITSHNFRGINANIVKVITANILRGLQYLEESVGVIHTDLKPENILLLAKDEKVIRDIAAALGDEDEARVENDIQHSNDAYVGTVVCEPNESMIEALGRIYKVKITDFGAARWVTEVCPIMVVQTREYRCPEVILGVQKLTPRIDIWSLACIVFELMTGDFLFDPKRQKEVDMDVYHWMLFRQVIGEVPEALTKGNGQHISRFFTASGQFRYSSLQPLPLNKFIQKNYGLSQTEADGLSKFLEPMIDFDPKERPSAGEMLDHPWLQIQAPPVVGAGGAASPKEKTSG